MTPIDATQLANFLGSLPLFAGLSEPHLEQLARVSQTRLMPKGSVIFLQGDSAGELYVVRKGSVTSLFSNPDGRELVVDEMRAGRYFGELALLTNNPRSMSLIAREKCELILIPRAAFAMLLEQEPLLARNLLKAGRTVVPERRARTGIGVYGCLCPISSTFTSA